MKAESEIAIRELPANLVDLVFFSIISVTRYCLISLFLLAVVYGPARNFEAFLVACLIVLIHLNAFPVSRIWLDPMGVRYKRRFGRRHLVAWKDVRLIEHLSVKHAAVYSLLWPILLDVLITPGSSLEGYYLITLSNDRKLILPAKFPKRFDELVRLYQDAETGDSNYSPH